MDILLNYIWSSIIFVSIICAIITGRMDVLSKSILSGSEEAISIVISMLGMMSLWSGLMRISESSGLMSIISKLLAPILKILFPDYSSDSLASKLICMNIVANFLGLGNAATPFGIMAIREMNKTNKNPLTANNSIAMFVVLNTASIQLIPTFLSILRQKHGSIDPFSILPTLWITSIIALIAGIISAKCLQRVC